VTGDAAFAWYPFPNHGIGEPLVTPIGPALADYVALELEQRGVFAKVVRVRDAAAAKSAGATLLMSGRVQRFGAMIAESHDPYVVRPDDWVEYHLVAAARYSVELARADVPTPLLARDCLGRDEEPNLADELTKRRGSQVLPIERLDAQDFPTWATHDLAAHARRALERATAPLVTEVERVVGPSASSP
jgi:hypothetical protein